MGFELACVVEGPFLKTAVIDKLKKAKQYLTWLARLPLITVVVRSKEAGGASFPL